jgi:hypothetical protein
VLRWAEGFRRGQFGVSGEVALGRRAREASRDSGEVGRAVGLGEGWLGQAGRGGQCLGDSGGRCRARRCWGLARGSEVGCRVGCCAPGERFICASAGEVAQST